MSARASSFSSVPGTTRNREKLSPSRLSWTSYVTWKGRSIIRLLGKEPYFPREMVLDGVRFLSIGKHRYRRGKVVYSRIGCDLEEFKIIIGELESYPAIGLDYFPGHFKKDGRDIGIVGVCCCGINSRLNHWMSKNYLGHLGEPRRRVARRCPTRQLPPVNVASRTITTRSHCTREYLLGSWIYIFHLLAFWSTSASLYSDNPCLLPLANTRAPQPTLPLQALPPSKVTHIRRVVSLLLCVALNSFASPRHHSPSR